MLYLLPVLDFYPAHSQERSAAMETQGLGPPTFSLAIQKCSYCFYNFFVNFPKMKHLFKFKNILKKNINHIGHIIKEHVQNDPNFIQLICEY